MKNFVLPANHRETAWGKVEEDRKERKDLRYTMGVGVWEVIWETISRLYFVLYHPWLLADDATPSEHVLRE